MDYSCIENPLVRDLGKKITFSGEVELRESDENKDLYKMLLQQSVGALLVHDDFQLNIKVELDCET